MTSPAELNAQLAAFKVEMGANSPNISVHLDDDLSSTPISVGLYTNWPRGDCEFRLSLSEWSEVMPALREKWAAHRAKYNAELIRKIALAIIEITAVNGECTDAALRGTYRFTDEQVRKFGADAVAKANEMAANGPFSIITQRGANAA